MMGKESKNEDCNENNETKKGKQTSMCNRYVKVVTLLRCLFIICIVLMLRL